MLVHIKSVGHVFVKTLMKDSSIREDDAVVKQ